MCVGFILDDQTPVTTQRFLFEKLDGSKKKMESFEPPPPISSLPIDDICIYRLVCLYIYIRCNFFLLGALCCLLFISDLCFQNNSDYYIAHKRKRIRLFLYNSSIREFLFQFDFGPAIMFRCRLIHLYSSAHCFAKKKKKKKRKNPPVSVYIF